MNTEGAKPRVVVRADASRNTGFGHLVRSLALCSYINSDFDCFVASFNADLGHLSDYQRSEIERVASPVEIISDDMSAFDREFLDFLRPSDIVVLDNYYFDTDYQRAVRSRCHSLVCIDDMHQRHFVCDVLLTFIPLERDAFSMESYTRFYGGIDRAFLRPPFLSSQRLSLRSVPPRTIFLAMGGADPLALTPKLTEIILRAENVCQLHILAGDTVKIPTHLEDRRVSIHRRASADEVRDLLDSADLAIIPASTISVEAFSRNTPIALGYFVDNQHELYDYLTVHNLVYPLGNLLDTPADLHQRLQPILNGTAPTLTPHPFDFQAWRLQLPLLFKSL